MTPQPQTAKQPLEQRSDDELVRAFAGLRGSKKRGERRAALRAWHVLTARHHDRVAGWVATFRFPEHPEVVIAPADREDVVQQAHERCLEGLSQRFRGTTAAEFRAALKTCVQYACMDHSRATMRREKGIAGSIDEQVTSGESDEIGRFDGPLAELAERLEDGRFGAALDRQAIGRALDELQNADARKVIRLTIEGYTSREIAEEIGKTVANVDQLRSRGLRELKGRLADS